MRLAFAIVVGMLTIGVARADTADLRTGSYNGIWCGYGAVFNIESQEGGDRWVFHGTIYFPSYKQYDTLWIEQYTDNSLRMIRYLSGADAGQVQTVQTYAPTIKQGSAGPYADFEAKTAFGIDCEGKRMHFKLQ